MFRNLMMALGLTLAAWEPVFAQTWAARMFAASEHDFGNVARGAKAEYAFVFSNIYLEDVHVVGVHTSCGCTSARIENPSLKTYETGAIVAILNTDSFLGQRGATIYVDIDKPFPASVELHVKGFIRSDVVFEPGSVQFGDMQQGATSKRSVRINCFGRDDWRIVDVRGTNSHLVVDLSLIGRGGGQVSYEMTVNADGALPSGYLSERVMLVSNDPESPQIPLLVEGRVLPAITVSPASLFLGVVQPGDKIAKQLVVEGKQPFRILSIACDDKSFRFGDTGNATAKKLHVVPVSFLAGKSAGRVSQTIRITTDLGAGATPELTAYAVVAEK